MDAKSHIGALLGETGLCKRFSEAPIATWLILLD